MKKIFALFLILAIIVLSFASCGRDGNLAYDEAYNEVSSEAGYSKSESDEEIAKDEQATDDVRKIIKTYNLSLETKNFEQDAAFIVSEAEALGGYIANSSVSGNRLSADSRGSRSARYTVRVPANALDSYVASVSSVCNVYSSSLTTEDVTDSYYGIQAQLESLVIQEQKLTEMLAEADNLQDMIVLDDKLTSVRSEINSLNYRLQSMDKSVNYSYVYITLNEVYEYHVEEKTYLQEVGEAIVGSFRNFTDVIGNIVIVMIWVLPFGLVISVIVLLILFCGKLGQKKRMKKQNDHSEHNQ